MMMASQSSSRLTQRIESLDVMRSLAVLFIVLYHYEGPFLSESNFAHAIKSGLWVGVDIFFVLSGYLISSQLLKSFENIDTRSVLTQFYLKRAFRILPNYFFVLALHIIVAVKAGISVDYFKYFLFIQNLSEMKMFIPSWSLCVEEHFYIFFPIVLLAAFKLSQKSLFYFSMCSILVSFLIRIVIAFFVRKEVGGFHAEDWLATFYYPTYTRLDGLFMGVFISVLQSKFPMIWQFCAKKYKIFGVSGLMIFCLSYDLIIDRWSLQAQIFTYLFLAISFGCLLIYALNTSLRAYHFFTFTSNISYSMYLMFYFSQLCLFIVLRKFNLELPSFLHFAAYISLTYLMSFVLYSLCEKPFLLLRKRIIEA